MDALRASLDVPDGVGPVTSSVGRIVLLIDSYEHLAPLDDWLRTRLVPRLPLTALTVIRVAGRQAPCGGPIRPPMPVLVLLTALICGDQYG